MPCFGQTSPGYPRIGGIRKWSHPRMQHRTRRGGPEETARSESRSKIPYGSRWSSLLVIGEILPSDSDWFCLEVVCIGRVASIMGAATNRMYCDYFSAT